MTYPNMNSNPGPKKGAAFVVLLALACGASALAQPSPAAADQTTLIQQLLRRIDQLESTQREMQQELKGGPRPTPAPAPPPVAAAVATAAPSLPDTGPVPPSDDLSTSHTLGQVYFRGFSNMDYGRAWFEKLPPGGLKGTPKSFTLGDFDLFTNTQISEHWSMLGEMLVTSDSSNEFSVEMDRLLLSYRKNNRFKVSIGKYNTAVGFFTNEFHRAQYFQTSIGRPIMYADEDNGGLMPVHSIGVSTTGTFLAPNLGLNWVAEVANGRSSRYPDVPIHNFQDDNNGKAFNLALYARPEALSGFQAGFSWYSNKLYPVAQADLRQNIYTVHAVYQGFKLEWLNEGAVIQHVVRGGPTYHAITAYTQLAWKVGNYRPYFKYDYQNVGTGDPIFGESARRNGPTVGMSRRLSNYVVFKVQYGRLSVRDATPTNALQSQLAFAF